MEKQCAWGTRNNNFRYAERIGNVIDFIQFPKSNQNRAKCPQAFNPNHKEEENMRVTHD